MDYLNCKNLPLWAQILLMQPKASGQDSDERDDPESTPRYEEPSVA